MQDSSKDDKTHSDDGIAAEAQAVAEQKVQSIDEQLGNIIKKVADKIKACENILVALSNDPNVDEISAAIGLTMVLNRLGKHVTAIYSGETPNTLEFLKPNETFEKDTNSLQDFIIALNKDKADHLRYKIEGDYVKVYITPYKTTISQNDLEFSQGDFNVDLVVSIDVDSAEVLDAALEEYGRIMHDATAINITTNQAGHFAELEWSDPSKSSVCEMIVNLCEYLDMKNFDQPVATALLTGIVSSTDRFSNARTTSETMQISSRLMQAGADQQLIASNIMQPAEEPKPAEEPAPVEEVKVEEPKAPESPLEPLIPAPSLAQPAPVASPEPVTQTTSTAAPSTPEVSTAPETPAAPETPISENPTPEQQLEQAIKPASPSGMPASLATELANATPEVLVGTPSPVEKVPAPSLEPAGAEGLSAPESVKPEPIQQPSSDTFTLPGQTSQDDLQAAMNEILNPASNTEQTSTPEIISQGSVMAQNVSEPMPETPDYGAMIDQALTDAINPAQSNPAIQAAPAVPATAPEASTVPILELNPAETDNQPSTPVVQTTEPVTPTETPIAQASQPAPATPVAPVAPTTPEAPAQPVEVPQADIDIELPPPPIPSVSLNGGMPPTIAVAPEPVMPAAEPVTPTETPIAQANQPASTAPVTPTVPAAPTTPETPTETPATPEAPVLDPSAFQIPQA